MFSIFFAYTLFVQILSPLSGEYFSENQRMQKYIKPISITFDDGPHRIRTTRILDILKSENIPATFFVVGNRIPGEGDILRRMVREWHKIGNHSFSHPELPKLGWENLMKEILFTNVSIFRETWKYPKYLRFPYGLADIRIHSLYSGKLIGWSVDGADWKEKNPTRLAQKIVSQTKSGSIILLHDIKEDTVLALPIIIRNLKSEWYTFVSLDTLLPQEETVLQKKWIWLNATKNIPIKKKGQTISRTTEMIPIIQDHSVETSFEGEWIWNF